MVLTVKVSQLQEEHFHTEGRGKRRPGHNLAERLCTRPPMATGLPQYSSGLQTPTGSVYRGRFSVHPLISNSLEMYHYFITWISSYHFIYLMSANVLEALLGSSL